MALSSFFSERPSDLIRRSLLDIENLAREDLEWLLSRSQHHQPMQAEAVKKLDTLRGKTIVNLFFESSTRTRASFEIAAKRLDADTIRYEFTVEDPTTWSRPWSVQLPMVKAEGPLYPYTCHEGNYGMVNTLRGARRADGEGR